MSFLSRLLGQSRKPFPTDLEILQFIYDAYYPAFINFQPQGNKRITKVYVPIDVDAVGHELGIDGDIIYSRLYYHLNNKYSVRTVEGSAIEFFADTFVEGERKESHCVHFPLMASVLAELRNAKEREDRVNNMAVLAILVSIIAAIVLSIAR